MKKSILSNDELRNFAHRIRLDVLKMTADAGANGGHIGGAFSSAEILAVITRTFCLGTANATKALCGKQRCRQSDSALRISLQ